MIGSGSPSWSKIWSAAARHSRSSARDPSPSPAMPVPRRSGGPPVRDRISGRVISPRGETGRRGRSPSPRTPCRRSIRPAATWRRAATRGCRRPDRAIPVDGGELLGDPERRPRGTIGLRLRRSPGRWVLGGRPSRPRGIQDDAEHSRASGRHGLASSNTDMVQAVARAGRAVRRGSRHGRIIQAGVPARHQRVLRRHLSGQSTADSRTSRRGPGRVWRTVRRDRDESPGRVIDGTREAYPWDRPSSRSPCVPRVTSHRLPVSHLFSSRSGHACGERLACADAVPAGRGNLSSDGAATCVGPRPAGISRRSREGGGV